MHAAVLRYFDQVARDGSIRRAAEVLNVAPSAVTRQILNLEAEIGARLFERLATGVRLTPAGQVLLRHARRTLADWRSTSGEIAALSGEVAGEVRILVVPPLTISVLAVAITELARQHQRLNFNVTDAGVTNKAEQMHTGYPDIAMLPYDRRYREYHVVDSLDMKVGVVVTPDHPLAGKSRLTLTECAAYPVMMMQDTWLQQRSELEFQESGADYAPRILSSSWPLVREATRQGLGVGFFTPVGVAEELGRGELIFIPLTIPQYINSHMSLYVHIDRVATPEVAVTVEAIKARFSVIRALLPTATAPKRRGMAARVGEEVG